MSTTARGTARATATKPIKVSAELKALLRRLKLGKLFDTLARTARPGLRRAPPLHLDAWDETTKSPTTGNSGPS